MFCSKCGGQLANSVSFCNSCGNPVFPQAGKMNAPQSANPYLQQHQAPTSGLAIVAFIMSLIFSIVGLILGYLARNEIRNSGGTKSGENLATAAIVIGWIFTILGIIGFFVIAMAAASALTY